MAKAKKNTPNWGAVKTITEDMADKDRQRQEQKEFEQKLTLKLSQVVEREIDTRPLHLAHVEALGESIAVLGLLEPLVVDSRNRLLAGGHRLAAIRLLKEQNPQAYQTHFPNEAIQVRVMSFDAEADPDLALQVEVAENEHRRDYTPSEVRALADRLQNQGYKRLKGRPGKGEKSLVLALAFVINKSKRTVERYLKEETQDNTEQSASAVALSQERTALRNTYKNLKNWEKALADQPETPKRQSLAKKIPSMMRLIDAALAEIDAIQAEDA
ncbi:MAG: ParB/RepB/Spo0J family partition protein [Cyanobacteria bacterium P01_A01_bin.83]